MNDYPYVVLSEKEKRASERAYRKFMRRRGLYIPDVLGMERYDLPTKKTDWQKKL